MSRDIAAGLTRRTGFAAPSAAGVTPLLAAAVLEAAVLAAAFLVMSSVPVPACAADSSATVLARAADPPATVLARAADPPPRTMSKADSAAAASKPKTAPWKVMARSAVVPGWGQLYNHQPLKAALVVGAEGTLVALALHELKLQNDAKQRAVDAAVFGDSTASALAALEAETHRNRKISWIWWTLAAHLLSMADAYVDAHLSTFDSDFERQESLLPPRPGDRLAIAIAYRVRF